MLFTILTHLTIVKAFTLGTDISVANYRLHTASITLDSIVNFVLLLLLLLMFIKTNIKCVLDLSLNDLFNKFDCFRIRWNITFSFTFFAVNVYFLIFVTKDAYVLFVYFLFLLNYLLLLAFISYFLFLTVLNILIFLFFFLFLIFLLFNFLLNIFLLNQWL